jgi:hypothetical protein
MSHYFTKRGWEGGEVAYKTIFDLSMIFLWDFGILSAVIWGHRGHHRRVIGFTTTCAINAGHH